MTVRLDECVGWFPWWRTRRLRVSVARGFALFAGAFMSASVAAGTTTDTWLVDLRAPSTWVATWALGLAAATLIWYGVRPGMSATRRVVTLSAAGMLALAALRDSVRFYATWASGAISPGWPFPLSALVFAGFLLVLRDVREQAEPPVGWRPMAGTLAAALAFVLAFPLAQGLFFGCTDYRRPADVAIVPGAKAYPDGTLSTVLEDRVTTAVSLYRSGLVERLIMSGAVGREGIDESFAMKTRAVELGVPPSCVETDSEGVDTDATAQNTRAMLADGERALVVSQPYHLPRLKLAFATAGIDVATVPAASSRPVTKTPIFAVREIGAFWVYWAGSCLEATGRRVLRALGEET